MNRMKMAFRRLLGTALAAVFVVSSAPQGAFAAEAAEAEKQEVVLDSEYSADALNWTEPVVGTSEETGISVEETSADSESVLTLETADEAELSAAEEAETAVSTDELAEAIPEESEPEGIGGSSEEKAELNAGGGSDAQVEGSKTKGDPEIIVFARPVMATMKYAGRHYYKLTLPTPGRVIFRHNSPEGQYMSYILFDEDSLDDFNRGIWTANEYKDSYGNASISGEFEDYIDLIAGTFYLEAYFGGSNAVATQEVIYGIQLDYDPITPGQDEILLEDKVGGGENTDRESARKIELNQKYVTQVNDNNNYSSFNLTTNDWFEFYLDKPGKLYLSLASGELSNLTFYIWCWNDIGGYNDWYSIGLKHPDRPQGTGGQNIAGWQLFGQNVPVNGKYVDISTFPKGKYYLEVVALSGVNDTGSYRFLLSSKNNARSISNMKLNTKAIAMANGSQQRLVATVTPANAYDTSVSYLSDSPEVVSVDRNGVLTAHKPGNATIKVWTNSTKKKGKQYIQVVQKCEVVVVEEEGHSYTGTPIVNKQKVDLLTEDYFGAGKAYDKYEVTPTKKYGAVAKNGVFTAKLAGEITITGYKQVKVGKKKLFVAIDTVTFIVEEPIFLYPFNKNGKRTAPYVVTEAGDLDLNEIILCEQTGIMPVEWSCSDKKGDKFTVNASGILTVKGSGSCTVTAVYGSGNMAAKYPIKIKATLP